MVLLLIACAFQPAPLGAGVPEPGGGSMSLLPGAASSLLVAWQVEADLVPPTDPDTGAVDTGGDTAGDTAPQDGGAVDSGADGGSDTADTSDPCAGSGYIVSGVVDYYGSPGAGETANLGTLSGVGYLCSWSCDGDPWWVEPIASTTSGGSTCSTPIELPADVGAASVNLCVKVYTTGKTSSATCRAVYTGGETVVEVVTG